MLVIIKDNTKLNRLILKAGNNYSYKQITIYYKNVFYISLGKDCYFEDGAKIKKLLPRKYEIRLEGQFYCLELYVYEDDKGINDYSLFKNDTFVLAHNKEANIISYDPYLKDSYLLYKDHKLKSNEIIILNGKEYKNQELRNGDEVTFLSFSFYYFNEFLYINNFLVKNKIEHYEVCEYETKYLKTKNISSHYIPEQYDKEYKIKELEEYNYTPVKKENIIKQLAPAIVMSFSMSGIAAINYLNALDNNQSLLNRLMFLMMPISMILSGVMIPLVISIVDKHKNKKEQKLALSTYLQYLDEFEKEEDERLQSYIEKVKSHFFILSKAKKMLFFAGKKTEDFLCLSIGYKKMNLVFAYKKTNNDELNKKLVDINNQFKEISDEPFFLDIKEYKTISIVSKNIEYFFNKTLIELCFKHHYDDVKIAVFIKEENTIDMIYNVPHLFYKGRRLILKNEVDLQRVDQLKIDKPLIVLLHDSTSFHFSNNNIHVIYFSNSIDSVYKDSAVILDYSKNIGTMYGTEYTSFTYYEEKTNYQNYYKYLEQYNFISDKKISYSFRDVFDYQKIADYYQDIPKGLKASFAYTKENILDFDLHESKQGPHGLIGGSTGSGKSELIVSLLLSLCIRYSPEYLNIILIDYKGGGIKESLSYKQDTIPHIIASVSNLEDGIFERVIIAINNECRKRQEQFKTLSRLTGTSIMNIDDYLENGYKENGMEAMAHLLIVVDEFAEMKKEHHEYIKELISLSRIGRSLGVHLILATQKPGGVIDDEIWSNSHFKLALKVFEEKDSSDIIKVKDAAYLTSPGEFLLQVDDSITWGKSMYAKKDINDNEPYSVSLLNYTLEEKYKKTSKEKNAYSEAMLFTKEIIDVKTRLNIKVNYLEYSPPIEKTASQLRDEYDVSKTNIIFGEVDDYYNNSRFAVSYDINENALIYTSRRKEINGIINHFMSINKDMAIISNREYQGKNIVASLKYEDDDDIDYLFRLVNERNDIELTLIIEDLSCFLAYKDEYQEIIYRLCRKTSSMKMRLMFLTYNSNVNFKILNSIKNKLAIKILDDNDLINIFTSKSKYRGDSFYPSDELLPFVPCTLEQLNNQSFERRTLIKTIPDTILPEIVNDTYLLGYHKEKRDRVIVKEKDKILITSFDEELIQPYQKYYVNNPNMKICIYDNKLVIENYMNILFIGPGIFSQRLFVSGLKEDINENEGYLIKGNKRCVIKTINGTVLSKI